MGARLAIVYAAATLVSTTAAADPGTMLQVPGGVVDPSQQLAYLQNARGGLDAVELATGHVRWSDAAVQRPVAGANGRLLVERVAADGVRLCVRAASQSGRAWATERLPLPPWAIGGPARGRSFEATVEWVGGATLRYRWSAAKRWSQGMHPPRNPRADDGDPAPPTASGAMLVDLKSAKISVSAAAPAPPAASMAYQTDHGTVRTAWWVDGVWCSLATETVGGASSWVVRRRRGDGQELAPVQGVRATTVMPKLSLDGRLLVMLSASGGRAPSLELPSGHAGPALNAATLAREFAVTGPLLLQGVDGPVNAGNERPSRELRAIGLDDESLKWTHPLYAPPALPPAQ